MTDHTKPTAETRTTEREEAKAPHVADREPTADEAAATEGLTVDPKTAQAEREMAERGANQKGEGKI